ncbi:MAG: hypothetical protein U0798_18700 [Gemmataceae bacterium]
MRVRLGMLAVVAAFFAGAGNRALGQDSPIYKHTRNIFFPIPIERLNALNPKPTKVRLWAAAPGQKWKVASEKAPNELDQNGSDGNRGLYFNASDDGEYEFALQQVFADGTESPRESSLKASYRVVFDTKPPSVQAAANGTTGIEWDCRDENLDQDGITVQARYKDTNQKWTTVLDHLRPQAQHTWTSIPNGYSLEVRVSAKDKAGNESFSRIVTLPTMAGGTGLLGASGSSAGRTNDSFPRNGTTSYGDDFPNRPEIQYVNTLNFDVKAKITRITKSGVGKVVLFVREEKTGWKKYSEKTTDIRFEQNDQIVPIPFAATADGLYEFRVVPMSNASIEQNLNPEAPNKNDPAQILVKVDMTKPEVSIRNVKVLGAVGGGTPRIEIDYKVSDANLVVDNPVILEWSRTDNDADNWEQITRTRQDGPFMWDNVPDKEWKLYIRARAIDKAGNEGKGKWDKAVYIDLERPEATIEKIERVGGVSGGGSGSIEPATERKPAGTPSNIPPAKGNGGSNLIAIPGLSGSPGK